jgi:hypothetical protein
MTQMTSEQILARLAQITGKSNEHTNTYIGECSDSGRDSSIAGNGTIEPTAKLVKPSTPAKEQPPRDVSETGNWSEEDTARAVLWGGVLSGRGVIIENSVQMSKKDYQKHIKGKTQDDILSDPLLYILFRSEEQSESNFFQWLDKFPKAKDESKQQK